ncbi:MAG: extracellular solute-binding protein [Bifidobacterium subtile]|jgi:multiple sugar transport system substrate-binding protein/raffinose/stachyose/melibiose transport system substrate-binding protein|nr:extracellular solute-binding protein [Bifidobacterium subtile]MCI1241443.1 extracellular solute-binding protein [Bifidobacterium subtile]MCI1258441.1 extracellular solute-binding protein [Bifidobacterium subtile]
MSIGKSIKTVLAGVLAVGCLASVAACGPGSSGSGANAKSEPVSTDLGSTKYELRLWDGAGLKKFDDQLIAAFQKKHPNITIKATYDPDNTSQQNGPRVISAADTPDIARVTDINSAVRGKHLVNLDPYAKAYGWKLPDAQTESYRVGSDGKIGSGSLYAVPDGVSMTGLYWNKKIAKQLGINEAPATVEELEADMKKATDAGVLAMMMPAKEGGTSYIYQALLTNYEGRDKVQDWIVQKDGATFKNPGAVKAAEKIKQWQDAHYFSSDALAFDGSTALSRFSDGKALFFPSGSWYSDSINTALGQDSGWVAYPGEKSDSGSAAANAVSAFGIPANAKNKNAAAAFLDFLRSDTARQIAVDNGYPPIGEGAAPKTDNQLLGQILTAYQGLVKSGNTTDYINNATAGIQASAIVPGFQSLIDGTMKPQQFVDSIQAQYDKEVK